MAAIQFLPIGPCFSAVGKTISHKDYETLTITREMEEGLDENGVVYVPALPIEGFRATVRSTDGGIAPPCEDFWELHQKPRARRR